MRKHYNKRNAYSSKQKPLLVVGVLALLIILFFLSFWITGLILKVNQNPEIPEQVGVEATATPKPTYEELEKMVIEQQETIEMLEEELAQYRTGEETVATAKPTEKPNKTEAAKTAEPTKVPKANPTVVPTKAPTAAPAAAPTAEPTIAPTKKPGITIVAPGASGVE